MVKVVTIKNTPTRCALYRTTVVMSSACLGEELCAAVSGSRVLVVGTGGIGCELLKNLVLTGFKDISAVGRGGSVMRWRKGDSCAADQN